MHINICVVFAQGQGSDFYATPYIVGVTLAIPILWHFSHSCLTSRQMHVKGLLVIVDQH
jgi:hypothetical protein